MDYKVFLILLLNFLVWVFSRAGRHGFVRHVFSKGFLAGRTVVNFYGFDGGRSVDGRCGVLDPASGYETQQRD